MMMGAKAFTLLLIITISSMCLSEDVVKRVKGGQNVDNGDVSFTVKIERNGKHVCNGVFIDRKYVLTLRKCVEIWEAEEFKLLFTPMDSTRRQSVVVTRTIRFPAISDRYPDIVILALKRKLRRGRGGVRPFKRFATSENESTMTRCKVIGFKSNEHAYNEVDVNIKSTSKCQGSSEERNICFDAVRGKVCEKDDGSAIICKSGTTSDKKWYLMGLASAGKGCQADSINGVRISYNLDFLYFLLGITE